MLKLLSEIYRGEMDVNSASKPYSYRWNETAPRSLIPGISDLELLYQVISKQYMNFVIPTHLSDRTNLVLGSKTDAERLTPRDFEEWQKKVFVVPPTQPLNPPTINSQLLQDVQNALFKNLKLRVSYKNQFGEFSSQVVCPVGIIDRAPFCYLIAFRDPEEQPSKRRKGPKPFMLHRILEATVLDTPFKLKSKFDLEKYVQEGRYIYGKGRQINLSFEIKRKAGHHITEAMLTKDQVVEEVDDRYIRISATVYADLSLYIWINGFGDQVRNVEGLPPFDELFSEDQN